MTRTWLVVVPLVVVACVVIGPLALIWALNTLFDLAIPYTLRTWAAAVIMSLTLNAASASYKR